MGCVIFHNRLMLTSTIKAKSIHCSELKAAVHIKYTRLKTQQDKRYLRHALKASLSNTSNKDIIPYCEVRMQQ